MEQIKSIFSVVMILLLMALVMFLAYFTTKFIGKKYSANSSNSKYIKVLDRISVGNDKTLLIVQVLGQTMLVGAAAQGITKLCDIDDEQIQQEIANEVPPPSFLELLKGTLQKGGSREGDPPGKEG